MIKTKMSNQIRLQTLKQSDTTSTDIAVNNTYKKRKKLSLTKELLGGIMQFKRMMISRHKNDKMSGFLQDGARREAWTPRAVERDGGNGRDEHAGVGSETKRLLRCSVTALQHVIVRERWHKRDYVDALIGRRDALEALDRDKREHLDGLERFLADEDRVIASLRADIERAHDACEAQNRRRRQAVHDKDDDDDEAAPVARRRSGHGQALLEAVDEFASFCDHVAALVRTRDIGGHAATTVDALRADARALVADVSRAVAETVASAQPPAKADVVRMVARQLEDVRRYVGGLDDLTAIVDRLQDAGGDRSINEFLALCYIIKIVYENNRTLENAAGELDDEMEMLQTSLSDVTSEYMALDASKSDKKCESVVLDDFCAVTEEITAHQIRNLEFGRILAVDEEQIAEELNKIQQLKAKISKKKNKKQILLKEKECVKRRLEESKSRYEDLERRKNFLADDLMATKRSPGKLADQCELHYALGQRAKHLKQLKVQYNKLTNKRDALKVKLQKHQQVGKTAKSD